MLWITLDNLRRFVDKLFHSTLSFYGSVTHNGADEFNGGVKVNTKPLEINGGVKVNTTKAEFNAPVAFTGTTTYNGNEIATKADITNSGGGGFQNPATGTLDMNGNSIYSADIISLISGGTLFVGECQITEYPGSEALGIEAPSVHTINMSTSSTKLSIVSGMGLYVNDVQLISDNANVVADVNSDSVSAKKVIVSNSLTIPGGKVWIE